MEWQLAQVGAVKSDLEDAPKGLGGGGSPSNSVRLSRGVVDRSFGGGVSGVEGDGDSY